MKKILTVLSVLGFIGVSGTYGYALWQESISKAVLVATTMQEAEYRKELSKLKSKHKKELDKLTKKNSKKVDRLIREHKGELAQAKTRERAKAKVQRAAGAIPLVGVGAFALFEKLEFENWKSENPQGTFEQYSLEIGNEINEVLKEEYGDYYEEYTELFMVFKK